MDMITVKQAAEKWGVTPRRVQGLCKEGKLQGAVRWERTWMIPSDAVYPKSGEVSLLSVGKPIPRKSASLVMTDLYHTPGTADAVIASLSDNPQAAFIFAAEIAYNRLEFDRMDEYAHILLHQHTDFHTVVASGIQLCLCAAYNGDIKLFKEARYHIFEAPCTTDADREIVSFWLSVVDYMLGEISLPEWFRKGRFETVPYDDLPAVRFQYAKFQWLNIRQMILSNDSSKKEEGILLLKSLPKLLEPMISQAMLDKTLLAEIGLRIICAVVYHDIGQGDDAVYHLDKAITLAVPDRLYAVFVEFIDMFDTLLYERLAIISPEALTAVKAYKKKMSVALLKLHSDLNLYTSYDLAIREREAAKLAAFGMTNGEIAKRMNITENSVRSLLSMAMNKTGAKNRKELGLYL